MSAIAKLGISLHRRRARSGAVRRITSDLDGTSGEERVEHALREERFRVGRELHDGALQSLAGAALQLEGLAVGIGGEFQGIRKRLRDIQGMILEEERDLRSWIEALREAGPLTVPASAEPGAQLRKICRRIQRQWGLPVKLNFTGGRLPGPPEMRNQIYRLVQEGLINIVKHAHASAAQVDRSILDDRVRIVVQDNGCGFPFRGRFNLAVLNAKRCGPESIKERVASMHGELVLTSSASGSCLEIDLPLRLRSLADANRAFRRI